VFFVKETDVSEERMSKAMNRHELLPVQYGFMFALLFHPEDGDDMFFRKYEYVDCQRTTMTTSEEQMSLCCVMSRLFGTAQCETTDLLP
jgi:hypothetical protein